MNLSDKKRFADSIATMAEAFGRALTPLTLKAFELGLDDIPIEQIERACTERMRNGKFFPNIAEIREACGCLTPTARAAKAFQCLSEATLQHGYYRTVLFDDPVLNATVNNLGGWQRLCDITAGDEWDKWFRKEFERVYAGFAAAGIGSDEPLIGWCDSQNRFTGHQRREPLQLIATGLPALSGLKVLTGPEDRLEHKPELKLLTAIGEMPKELQRTEAAL